MFVIINIIISNSTLYRFLDFENLEVKLRVLICGIVLPINSI